ncbi:hypothetical protein [Tardiphaga sp. 839_C3_N1_4]|uniref:hypothetical protein n=1 Tax=Tardiphaga sp. 839_C3_N1_4 TaxID=3240761 RepID=UPI003F20BBC1
MKALRFLRALPLALLMIAPARADQGTIVGPVVGPKTMAEVMTTINGALLAIQSCNSGTSAPANGPGAAPKAFQCWADTSALPVVTYKTHDGTSWVAFGQLNTSTHVWTPYRNGALIAAVATSSSAADLTTGTLPAARLPVPTASTLGGVQSKTCSASQWLNEISTSGVPNCAQPNFTDLAGTAAVAQLPAFSGMSAAAAAADADTFPTNQGGGNLKQTLAAIKTWIKAWIVKADVGLGNVDNTSDATKWASAKTFTNTTFNCGSTGNVCTVRLASDITGFGTGVATALGVNIGSAGAPLLFNGAGGTPSSMVGTNITGTAAGLTAGNVTTNANMTGDVTSVGNVTTLTNAPVIAKVLTAFAAGAGTVSPSDSILTAFQKVVGNIALKLNAASPSMTGTADVQGTLKLSSFVTSTQLTANQNDYTATDGSNTCATKTSLRISTNASRNVTGLSCSQAEGDIRIIHNVGSFNAVLTNQDAGSTAANRFLFGGDMTLAADTSVTIKYDGVASRWRAITTPGAGGGGGGVTGVTIAAGQGVGLSGTCAITTTGTCTVAVGDNILINPEFRINQRGYASAATLASGAKGHDRWKAGSSGGDYSFTQSAGPTQITIAANKTLMQVVEDKNVEGGTYTLSWTGTCQARFGINTATPSGSYSAGPVTISGQTGGTTMAVEFGNGASSCTLGKVKLEAGAVASPYRMRSITAELSESYRYYWKLINGNDDVAGTVRTGSDANVMIQYPVVMRANPTIAYVWAISGATTSSVRVGTRSSWLTSATNSDYIASFTAESEL